MSLTSCVEEPFVPLEDIEYGRVLTPTDLEASVTSAGDVVTFDWSKSKGATEFELEITTDSTFAKQGEIVNVLPEQLPYSHKLVADETYFYRVRGVDSENGLETSNWAVANDPETGYMLQIKTYAIKPSVNPVVAARTDKSISLTWTPVSASDNEVTHIQVETPGAKAVEFMVPADDATKGIEVTGLAPSTMYTLTVRFKSADRGSVVAWTRPSTEGFTAVADTTAFKQALKDGATKIRVAYSDTPYVMGTINLAGDVFIVGESAETGEKPVVAGSFSIADGISSIRLEDLALSGAVVKANADGTGGMALQGHVMTISKACELSDVELVNVDIDTYQKGIYYDNVGAALTGHFLMDGVRVDNIIGSGGDCIDARNANSAIPEFVIRNSTFNGGCRTVVRLDANVKLGTVLIENNTFNNMCYDGSALVIGGSNVQGILAVKASSVTKFEVKNNLFLNNKCWLVGSNTACKIPTFIGNYYYECLEQFFTSAKLDGSSARSDISEAIAVAEGGMVLTEDPCEDSMGAIFNVTEPSVIAAKIGDPRWFQPYVEIPEDLTQVVTETIHTWDFTDTKTFYKGAEKDMVRDGIRFYVKNTPIMFNDGLEFTGASTVEEGVPTDCGLGIKVNQNGSLIISTVASESAGDHSHLTVSLDGKVSASVPVGAEYQKVTFTGIQGQEHMIYVTACNPIVVDFLQWSDDVEVINTVLDTPEVKLSKNKVNERAEETIVVSWDAVDFAGSYDVTVDGKTKNVTDLSYEIQTKGFKVEDPGADISVEVVAVPASTDHIRSNSAPARTSFYVKDVPEEVGATGVAGVIKFDDYIGKASDGTLATEFEDGSIKLTVVADTDKKMAVDANSASFGTADAQTKYTTRFKTGASSGSKSGLKLTVAAKGTIKIAVRTGSNSAVRNLKVVNAGVEVLVCTLDESTQKHTAGDVTYYDYFTADVDAGEYDLTYDAGSANIYAIEYIPAPAGPVGVDGVIKFDDYIGKASDGTLATEFEDGSIKLTVVADADKKMAVDANSASFGTADAQTKYTTRFKTGASSGSKSGLKLTVAAKGTIKIAVRTGSNSAVRNLKVVNAGVEVLVCTLDESTQKHTAGDVTYYDYFTADVDAGEYDLTYDAGSANIYAIEYTAAK